MIYCLINNTPHPIKKLNYCKLTKKKVLKVQKRLDAIQELVDEINKTQDLRLYDKDKMQYDRKTSKYLPKLEDDVLKLGSEAYDSFK